MKWARRVTGQQFEDPLSIQYSQSHSCPLPLCLESKYICVTSPPVTQIRSRSQEVSSEPGARVGDEASEYADPPGDWWNVIWYDLMAKPESLMYRQYQRLLGKAMWLSHLIGLNWLTPISGQGMRYNYGERFGRQEHNNCVWIFLMIYWFYMSVDRANQRIIVLDL